MFVQKYLVQQGICSRREAEAFLREGLITVNGKKAIPGVPIKDTDIVILSPRAKQQLDAKTTVAIYKPRGVVCSIGKDTNEDGAQAGPAVFDILPQFKKLNIVGRLDKDSEGLLLLSNDGLITKAITGDTHEVEKEYAVTVQEHVSNAKLAPFAEGLTLQDGPTLPAEAHATSKHSFNIIIREGRNRQIRRMCGKVGLTVLELKRIRIGNIQLGSIKPGDYRKLTQEEINSLKSAA